MYNSCMHCHKEPYETNSEHWHYCNDCVKTCTICRETKPIFMFDFDFKSDEYKRWHEAKAYGFMNAAGHLPECRICVQNVAELMNPRPVIKKVTGPEAIQLMLDAMQKGTTATEKPDSTLIVE